MTATLAHPKPHHESAHRDRVAEALAARLYLTPQGAHQVLCGALPFRVGEIIRAHLETGDHVRLDRWMGPIYDALDHIAAPSLTPDLQLESARADSADDVARTDFQLHPDTDHARALSRAYGRTIAKLRLEQLALGAQYSFKP
jgi:hypothetical protein